MVLLKTVTAFLSAAAFHSAPGGYFQYAHVPGRNEYVFGFSRGNADHHVSRYEHGKDWTFNTKVTTDSISTATGRRPVCLVGRCA
jgi:hypothetical protein